jgi:hypothetical protein
MEPAWCSTCAGAMSTWRVPRFIVLAAVEHLRAKEVDATGGPAAAQVKSTAGCSVSDRESPWVTLLTGT